MSLLMIMTLTIMLLQISAGNKVQLNQHSIEEASLVIHFHKGKILQSNE